MKRLVPIVLCIALVGPTLAAAQVTVERRGEENPVLTVAKSTFWGGLTGLILGGAVALVAEDNEADIVKWFFVGGVFGGFGFGVYHVIHRPPAYGLIHFDHDRLAMRVPAASFTLGTAGDGGGFTARVALVAVDF